MSRTTFTLLAVLTLTAMELVSAQDYAAGWGAGCFRDPWAGNSAVLPMWNNRTTSDAMSARVCYEHCDDLGYRYFATAFGNTCGCAPTHATPMAISYAVPNGCTEECGGDKTQLCGGPTTANAWSVYIICASAPSWPGCQ